jgi:hypothetical protein
MPDIFELIGYLIATVLAMTIVLDLNKILRWGHIALASACIIYSFILGYNATGIISCGLVAGDLFLITRIMAQGYNFNILQVRGNNEYLNAFIEYYKHDIYHYSPFYKRNMESTCFLILNNIETIGVFIVTVQDKKTLYVNLDFVIPSYRNNQVGRYIFIENEKYFLDLGYEKIATVCLNETHKAYLLKMGFTEENNQGEKTFVKTLAR